MIKMNLKQYVKEHVKDKTIRLYFDIETYQYNQEAGKVNPSAFKNAVYSVAVSYFHHDDLHIDLFPNFYEFFEAIFSITNQVKTKPSFILTAHNGNKYDNHYLRLDLMYYYNLPIENLFINQGIDEANIEALKLKQIQKADKDTGIILEKRVKSQNNLELTIYKYGVRFDTEDSLMKMNMSLDKVGKKLFDNGYITKDEMKTDFDYTKYNLDDDLTDNQAKLYALEIFQGLDDDQLTYIRNDVILLGQAVKHYSDIFYGFDYSKMTFTANIADYYNTNSLTSFQLFNKVGQGRDTIHLKYTDYEFDGINFYDYLKPFYRGGLNFYNDTYLDTIIYDKVFAIDINSSYPYAMYGFKIPTFLKNHQSFNGIETMTKLTLDNDNIYQLFKMTKQTFDMQVLAFVKSKIVRQMLVKYYTTLDGYININTYTIKMINEVCHLNIKQLNVLSILTYDCVMFGSRDEISHNYYIKEQGKNKFKLDYQNPFSIKQTTEHNTENVYSDEEVMNSKVLLNGLYGIPALRPYFNVFRYDGAGYYNVPNGMKNNERNIVFSIFVTSVSLWNLLQPFKYLTAAEIDENFLYCDTDSMYIKKKVKDKISNELYHDFHLGKWSYDAETIDKFVIINHKKYAYEFEGKIKVRSAGIPDEAFDKTVTFEQFVEKQFSVGVKVKNTSSILNKQGVVSIYEKMTELKQGGTYIDYAYNPERDIEVQNMIDEISNQWDGNQEQGLYIESVYGDFSFDELYPVTHDEQDRSLQYYMIEQNHVKEFINS